MNSETDLIIRPHAFINLAETQTAQLGAACALALFGAICFARVSWIGRKLQRLAVPPQGHSAASENYAQVLTSKLWKQSWICLIGLAAFYFSLGIGWKWLAQQFEDFPPYLAARSLPVLFPLGLFVALRWLLAMQERIESSCGLEARPQVKKLATGVFLMILFPVFVSFAVLGVAGASLFSWPYLLCAVVAALASQTLLPRLLFRALPAKKIDDPNTQSEIAKILFHSQMQSIEIMSVDLGKRGEAGEFTMTMGTLGASRKIFLDSKLVSDLPPEEIGAVLAHELGHLKGHHVARIFLLELTLLAAIVFAKGILDQIENEAASAMSFFALLALYLVGGRILARWLSRRMEFSADTYAMKIGYGPALARALAHVAKESSPPESWCVWRNLFRTHPPTTDRIRRLEIKAVNAAALEPAE